MLINNNFRIKIVYLVPSVETKKAQKMVDQHAEEPNFLSLF